MIDFRIKIWRNNIVKRASRKTSQAHNISRTKSLSKDLHHLIGEEQRSQNKALGIGGLGCSDRLGMIGMIETEGRRRDD